MCIRDREEAALFVSVDQLAWALAFDTRTGTIELTSPLGPTSKIVQPSCSGAILSSTEAICVVGSAGLRGASVQFSRPPHEKLSSDAAPILSTRGIVVASDADKLSWSIPATDLEPRDTELLHGPWQVSIHGTGDQHLFSFTTVSYTHLTLPTNREV